MSRFHKMFENLGKKNQAAFIPFVVLLDPNIEVSKKIILTLIEAGADALELGLAFSDPIADGPIIQKGSLRALENKPSIRDSLDLISEIRQANSEIPIGILTYANLVFKNSVNWFYKYCQTSGVDAVLVADVPMLEAEPFCKAAMLNQIDPVLIAPPNLSKTRIEKLSLMCRGFTYVVTRTGVTGTRDEINFEHEELLKNLENFKAPPAVFGFGISTPEHVKQALSKGAKGVISGSKIVAIIEENLACENVMLQKIQEFVQKMKAATS